MRSKPSPAIVVSIVALIVALSGTAVAASVLITSSSQIKNGTIRGADLRNGTVTRKQLDSNVLQTIGGSSSGSAAGAQALEVHRLAGPDLPKGGSAQVAELALPRGTYAVFAKTTITPFLEDDGLLDTLLRDRKTVAAECTLDVSGTGDFSISPVASPGTLNPTTLNTQLTRTLDVPGKAILTCKVDNTHWNAANTSIIAMKVSGTTRTETP